VLEGAPSFAFFAKGGLLPSNATQLLLLAFGFAFSDNCELKTFNCGLL